MSSLGTTISRLARHRQVWDKLIDKGRIAPQTGHFGSGDAGSPLTEVTGFGSNPGALRMFTHVPERLGVAPALVVVLHGCTQDAAGYDRGAGWSTLADRHGFVVLLPQQQKANNPNACFNWFQPEDTRRDSGEALSIRQMVETAILEHGIDRARVFVTGLSAGGAMTTVMLAAYPDVFAAGAIVAGLPYGTAANVQQAFESMFNGRAKPAGDWGDLVRNASAHRGPWPRVSVWHGDKDATVKVANADDIARQWTNVHGIDGPPVQDVVDGYPRKVWRKGGRDMVESYTITGMAHGTPLATGPAANAVGVAGPFLLDVGISSSHHIATFFGLTGTAGEAANAPVRSESVTPMPVRENARDTARAADTAVAEATPVAPTRVAFVPDDRVEIIPDDRVEIIPDDRVEILEPTRPSAPPPEEPRASSRSLDIAGIINKALTAAGLMKPRK